MEGVSAGRLLIYSLQWVVELPPIGVFSRRPLNLAQQRNDDILLKPFIIRSRQ